MRKKEVKRTTYRVDLVISTGNYASYTSREGTDLGMAQSLATGLKRQSQGGRIVELPSGNVIDEWACGVAFESPNALRDAVKALREASGY